MNVHRIQWNAADKERLCLRCLLSSDAFNKEDAEHDLSQFDFRSASAPEPKPVADEQKKAGCKKTSVQAEIVQRGHDAPMRVTTTTLSLGGWYIENMFTLPLGALLAISFCA